jgi:hypothetical protein
MDINRTATTVIQVNDRNKLVTEERRVRGKFDHGNFKTITRLYHTTKYLLRRYIEAQGLGYHSRFILNPIVKKNYEEYNSKYIDRFGFCVFMWNLVEQ